MEPIEETPTGSIPRKPTDAEIDVYGLSHVGKVRKENQDHFLIASLEKHLAVRQTNLPDLSLRSPDMDRLAFLMMVADGVGGGAGGAEASRFTLDAITAYVTRGMHAYYTADPADDETFSKALERVALRVHQKLLARSNADPALHGMATTLTLFLGVWPRCYLLHVGDSRCYLWRDGVLQQQSRDQTMAEDLLAAGVIKKDDRAHKQWSHVLSSAIGGPQTAPVVTGMPNDWGYVHLLCSDGLTKHVTDERIAERLAAMTSSKQTCEALLQDALDGGGTDNITVLIARTKKGGI
ncbi:MAG: serine/threonine-protein phosphatase [Gemmatimonadetes bacterium]|nr:serine/threonine-protein phosphatase [Gemmatimonadota bacterium]